MTDPVKTELAAARAAHPSGITRLRSDLYDAARTFRRYQGYHSAKNTPESDLKAQENAKLAARFEETLRATAAGVSPPLPLMPPAMTPLPLAGLQVTPEGMRRLVYETDAADALLGAEEKARQLDGAKLALDKMTEMADRHAQTVDRQAEELKNHDKYIKALQASRDEAERRADEAEHRQEGAASEAVRLARDNVHLRAQVGDLERVRDRLLKERDGLRGIIAGAGYSMLGAIGAVPAEGKADGNPAPSLADMALHAGDQFRKAEDRGAALDAATIAMQDATQALVDVLAGFGRGLGADLNGRLTSILANLTGAVSQALKDAGEPR